MSGGFLATLAVLVALAAWYLDSAWPVALGAAYVALAALDLGRGAARHSALLWVLSHPARPLRMRWSFSVILTERAWDTLGVPSERRQELQQLIGEYPSTRSYLFKEGHPVPAWVSRPIAVTYERWGQSLERWTIENSRVRGGLRPPTHHEKRILEVLPEVHEADSVDFWGEWEGPRFLLEDGRLLFLNRDENVSVMPDGKLYVKEGAHVLFDIPAPTLSMSRGGWEWRWEKTAEPNPLDRFATPPDPPDRDSFMPTYYRRQGEERFECEDWAKGFRWDLEVNDLRQSLTAKVVRVRRSLWRRRVKGLVAELEDSRVKLLADHRVVEPTERGRRLPKKDEMVQVVLNDEGGVDRIWLHEWSTPTSDSSQVPTASAGADKNNLARRVGRFIGRLR
jgi:hypothetical protein